MPFSALLTASFSPEFQHKVLLSAILKHYQANSARLNKLCAFLIGGHPVTESSREKEPSTDIS